MYLLFGLVAIAVSLYIFYDQNSRNRLKKENRREEINYRKHILLNRLAKMKRREG